MKPRPAPSGRIALGLSLGKARACSSLETVAHAAERGARPIVQLAGEAVDLRRASHDRASLRRAGRLGRDPARAGRRVASSRRRRLRERARHRDAAERCVGGVRRSRSSSATSRAPVPVTSTKALIGHLLGSAGAVEAVATVLCLARREVHPMPDNGETRCRARARSGLGQRRARSPVRPVRSRPASLSAANAVLVFTRARGGLDAARPSSPVSGSSARTASVATRCPRRFAPDAPWSRRWTAPPATTQRSPSRFVAAVPKVDLARWLPPAEARRLERAVAATRWRRRGWPSRMRASRRLQAAASPWCWRRRSARSCSPRSSCARSSTKVLSPRSRSISRSASPTPPPRASRSRSARRAANVTITQREAGPLLAAGARRRRRFARAGPTWRSQAPSDEMTPLLHALLDRFRATARARRGPDEAARPFDALARRRAGRGRRRGRRHRARGRRASAWRARSGRGSPRPAPRSTPRRSVERLGRRG